MNELSKENMDRLFQERFKDFESQPPENLENRIKNTIDRSLKNTGVSSLFSSNSIMISLFIVVLAVASIGYYMLGDNQTFLLKKTIDNTYLTNTIAHDVIALDVNNQDIVNITNGNTNNNIISDKSEDIKEIYETHNAEKEVDNRNEIRPIANAGKDMKICGLSCNLNAKLSVPEASGMWTVQGPGNAIILDEIQPNTVLKVDQYGTYKLKWTETLNQQSSTDIISVTFNKTGLKVDSKINDATCNLSNGSIELFPVGGDGNYSYFWQNETNSSKSYRDNIPAGVYMVKVMDGNGCEYIDKYKVNNTGVVKAAFDHKELSLKVNTPVYFSNSTTVDGEKYKDQNLIFTWKLNNIYFSNATDFEMSFDSSKVYNVKLIAAQPQGCADSTESEIYIADGEIVSSNIFTPNGDGLNDVFTVKAKQLNNFKGIIFNRSGQKLYEWNDPESGWDGKLPDGSYAKQGTYFYIISGVDNNGKVHQYKNFFLLNR